jgi:hypothetical protein
VFFVGWGSVGHKIINKNFKLSMPQQMSFLSYWGDSLAAHGSDADIRKNKDTNEAPKHFIDIDSYAEFISAGRITQNLDSFIAIHGRTTVYDNGILPWAIIAAEDSLRNAFARRDWQKAMLFAADLGHYIGDGHMPLHITENYNGQLTGQTGIHSRYETDFIGKFSTQITYEGDSVQYISHIADSAFAMIYYNNKYVDSVLAADIYAKSVSGGSYNTAYYNALWLKLGGITTNLFKLASYRLACFIYTAWIDAGRPNLTGVSDNKAQYVSSISLAQNYPNPFNPSTVIKYSVPYKTHITLQVYNLQGKLISTLVNEVKQPGEYAVQFGSASGKLSSGVYFYKLQSENSVQTRKMLLVK